MYKKGMTLVEMLVAIAILLISSGAIMMMFVRSWEMNRFVLESARTQISATQGARHMVDVVRNARQADNGAFAVANAESDSLEIYANVDNDDDVERVRIRLSGTNIIMESRDPTNDVPPVYPSGYGTTRVLASNIVDTDIYTLFEYYDDTNTLLSSGFGMHEIKMVRVNFSVDNNVNRAPGPSVIDTFASIRNLSEHDRTN